MKHLDEIIEKLQQHVFDLLSEIQTTKYIHENAFKSICEILDELSIGLKGNDNISKQLLKEIYFTVKILRTEAPYFKEKTPLLINMAAKIEYYFELILKDLCMEDRKPGIPRTL